MPRVIRASRFTWWRSSTASSPENGRARLARDLDEFAGGETMTSEAVQAFLQTIDCYVMVFATYRTALSFEAKGLGGPTATRPPSFLTTRALPDS
jgi:hypothetical protein